MLGRYDFTSCRGEWLFGSPADPLERESYAQHSGHNPWFMSSSEYRPGRVMTDEELLGRDLLRRTDFFHRYLEPLGHDHRLCGVILRREDIVYHADVLRGRDQPEFDSEDRTLLGSILKHLTVSLETHRKLMIEHRENLVLRSVMDRMDSAVLVVDEDARVLFANARSADFLESFAGLVKRGDRVEAVSRSENRALLEAIAKATADVPEPGGQVRSVTVSAPGEPHPVVVSVSAGGSNMGLDALGESGRVAVVIAKDPYYTHGDFECCAFTKLYNFTPAQGRIVGLILTGHGLTGAARALRVSQNTARSHLKQVYQKTNTHSQIELVHLHARVCTDHI